MDTLLLPSAMCFLASELVDAGNFKVSSAVAIDADHVLVGAAVFAVIQGSALPTVAADPSTPVLAGVAAAGTGCAEIHGIVIVCGATVVVGRVIENVPDHDGSSNHLSEICWLALTNLHWHEVHANL